MPVARVLAPEVVEYSLNHPHSKVLQAEMGTVPNRGAVDTGKELLCKDTGLDKELAPLWWLCTASRLDMGCELFEFRSRRKVSFW